MARQVSVLNVLPGLQGRTQVTGVFWFPIAAVNARVPKPGFVSQLKDVTGNNAITTAEQASLESGAILEVAFTEYYAGQSHGQAYIQADLLAKWTDQNTYTQGLPAIRAFYGLTYNGTAWGT